MASTKETILVIGSNGQIGSELVEKLSEIFGLNHVIASDIKAPEKPYHNGPFETIDVLNKNQIFDVVKKHNVTQIYLLAALLSATAEKNPLFAWQLNMEGLFHVLDLAKEGHIKQVYWPSSIAAFGPNTPQQNTPQFTIMEPSTVYGISKQAGERWCEYYFNKFKVDVRSLRYPGLIGYKTPPGGGTTDYAVHIFHEALKHKTYTSFLSENTSLPMMYMPDAIRATVELMQAPAEKIKIRSSYNLAGISFSPKEIAETIKTFVPEFTMHYAPDFRQAIADSWPQSIDDKRSQQDWNWKMAYDLKSMASEMIEQLSVQYAK
jgi:nucleoside-diphosphate-sugar epimerase